MNSYMGELSKEAIGPSYHSFVGHLWIERNSSSSCIRTLQSSVDSLAKRSCCQKVNCVFKRCIFTAVLLIASALDLTKWSLMTISVYPAWKNPKAHLVNLIVILFQAIVSLGVIFGVSQATYHFRPFSFSMRPTFVERGSYSIKQPQGRERNLVKLTFLTQAYDALQDCLKDNKSLQKKLNLRSNLYSAITYIDENNADRLVEIILAADQHQISLADSSLNRVSPLIIEIDTFFTKQLFKHHSAEKDCKLIEYMIKNCNNNEESWAAIFRNEFLTKISSDKQDGYFIQFQSMLEKNGLETASKQYFAQALRTTILYEMENKGRSEACNRLLKTLEELLKI